jgi:hypothetical protein
MARVNAQDYRWGKVEVLGREGLFLDLRVDRSTVPEEWYFYEVRHTENDWCEPCEIAFGVLVNFMGTLLVKEPFDFVPSADTGNGYLEIDSETDWVYVGEDAELT